MAGSPEGLVQGAGGSSVAGDWVFQLPAPAAILRHTGEVVRWNQAALELLGWHRARPARLGGPGVPWFDRLLEAVSLYRQHRTVITRRRAGGRVIIELRASALDTGDIIVLFSECPAGSARRREPGQRQLHDFLRCFPVGVIIEQDGSVAYANAAAGALFGESAAELENRSITELVPAEVVKAVTGGSHASGGPHPFETLLRDGRTAVLEVSAITTQYGGRRAQHLIFRDLAERQHAQEQLRRSEEQLRHAQKLDAVGRLAAGVAHDFNNVLTAIHGHVQFLLEDLPEEGTARADALEIRHAADRATELTRQLLTFARRQPSAPRELGLNDVVSNLQKLLRRLIRPGISLQTVLQPNLPTIWADAGLLEQVLVNLVVNARDALGTSSGFIVLRTSTLQLAEAYEDRDIVLTPGSYVVLSVTDNGCGMSRGVRRQVFEPFFTTKAEGTGLGLATVYGIVRQAGGNVCVYSEEGEGTTVRVFLPAHGGSAGHDHTYEAQPSDVLLAGRVLIVEDDMGVRELARRVLERSGCRVFEASDGAEALAVAAGERHIDVVVTDLVLPGMRGDELARQIAARQPDAAVVLTSGFSEAALFVGGELRQQSGFLEKPFTPSGLVEAVRRALLD